MVLYADCPYNVSDMSSDNLDKPLTDGSINGDGTPYDLNEATLRANDVDETIGDKTTPQKKKPKREKPPLDPTDPTVIAKAAAAHNAILEAEAAANAEKEEQNTLTQMEKCKYYTSLSLGTVCIVSAFAFLFLVPFVLDPAISTMLHDFVDEPVTCKVSRVEVKHGKSNCLWSSCREGCTVDMYKCYQVRVIYSYELYRNFTLVPDIPESEWVDLTRFDIVENQVLSHIYNIFYARNRCSCRWLFNQYACKSRLS